MKGLASLNPNTPRAQAAVESVKRQGGMEGFRERWRTAKTASEIARHYGFSQAYDVLLVAAFLELPERPPRHTQGPKLRPSRQLTVARLAHELLAQGLAGAIARELAEQGAQ